MEVDWDKTECTRDDLIAALHAISHLARKYFWPDCHRVEPYGSLSLYASVLLTETERLRSE